MLTTGEIIKRRRIELGMSQEELARRVGYTSKTTIGKIELGENQLRQNKILEFAEALGTDPLVLLGIDPEIQKRAINYEVDMEKYPDLKELNSIIKANHTNPVFLSQLLNYARFLAATVTPQYITIRRSDGKKVPIKVKTLADQPIQRFRLRKKMGVSKGYRNQQDKNEPQTQKAIICQKESNGS